MVTPTSWQVTKLSFQALNLVASIVEFVCHTHSMSLKSHLLQEVLRAVKVLNSQVVVAKGEALLVGDLPDAGVRPLTALQLPLLSLLQSIDLQVIWGAKSKLLSYIVVPGEKVVTYSLTLQILINPNTQPTIGQGQTYD